MLPGMALALGVGLAAIGGSPLLDVGQPLPDLVLPTLEGGQARSLADYRGKPLVLHVFASW